MFHSSFRFLTYLVYASSAVTSLSVQLPSRSEDKCDALYGVDTPTGNPSNCTTPTKFFKQLVHHDSSSNETFLQQYQVIDQFFKPRGPILYYQGQESDYFPCGEQEAMYQFANETGGMVVVLQHRYFGSSVPFGLNSSTNVNWTAHDLRAMSLENNQMDAVTFVEWIKKSHPGASKSKAIGFGGSYPGLLVTLLRVNHPDTFYGTVAYAAPTNLDSSTKSKFATAWGDTNSRILRDIDAAMARKIGAAFTWLRARMAAKDFSAVTQALQLCYPPTSPADLPKVLDFALAGFMRPVQQNDPHFNSLPNLIKGVNAANTSADVLSAAQTAYKMLDSSTACTNWNYTLREYQANKEAGLAFTYLRCNQLPYPDAFASPSSLFGPIPPNMDYPSTQDPICRGIFNKPALIGGPNYVKKLGLDDANLAKTERLIISYGSWDPVSGLSTLGWHTAGDSVMKSRVIFVTGGGHGKESVMALPGESDAITLARKSELESIKEWLGMV
ncbi:peptidase S28 [Lophiotrema nucula]|uniref:Peptidase S28 n=1 Tax=Lophiotrema nucula TaxID=690887 RepID=A0A6A5ZLY2_9PLEO|nr:peptidase S28 [Lophiotrema nucula]